MPPLAPTDKASASTRMLLHDTQAALETFSSRVDKLCGEVEASKREREFLKKRKPKEVKGQLSCLLSKPHYRPTYRKLLQHSRALSERPLSVPDAPAMRFGSLQPSENAALSHGTS